MLKEGSIQLPPPVVSTSVAINQLQEVDNHSLSLLVDDGKSLKDVLKPPSQAARILDSGRVLCVKQLQSELEDA